ncbi:hypothetical protein BG004_005868 [Podila humilis]|nr:hypothetical protein BG004_005868 [Podila humilis]
MDQPLSEFDRGQFEAVIRGVRTVLQKRINHTAQSARFNHVDILSIGEDHVFVIHRNLLLQDINDYLSGSRAGLQRVFINVDYRLAKPELMPNNRYKAMEDYIRQVLLPEIQHRIEFWDDAELVSNQLPVPDKKELSLVTLTGWMLSYPVNYVLPCNATRRYQRWLAYQEQQKQSSSQDNINYSYDDYDNGYDSDSEDSNNNNDNKDKDNGDDGDDDDDQDSGRNCLANQVLVVTRVHLDPNPNIDGLRNHCLLSFSYPAELAERWADPSAQSPESPLSPAMPQREKDMHDRGLVPEDQISLGGIDSDRGEEEDEKEEKDDGAKEKQDKEGQDEQQQQGEEAEPEYEPMPGAYEPMKYCSHRITTTAPIPRKKLPRSSTFRGDKPLQFSNPDICAAGRTFLHQIHTRFQKQKLWQSWEVGQESVTLPVVAI